MSAISPNEIGRQLSEARENRRISLEQAERETRIRLKYLMAMEAGDFGALPNPVVARGFLRSYARYLGLDPEPLVEALQQTLPEPAPFTRPPRREGRHVLEMDLSRPAGSGLTAVLSAALVVLLFAIAGYWLWAQGYLSVPLIPGRGARTVPSPTLPPAITQPPPTPTAIPTVAPSPTPQPVVAPATATPTAMATTPATVAPTATPTPTPRRRIVLATPTPTPTPGNLLVVEVNLVDRTWLRALVDGQLVEEGLFDKGQTFTWEGQVVEIRTGNAGGMKLIVNGEDLGILGAPGEVQHWLFYLKDGEVMRATPTPTPAPTGE